MRPVVLTLALAACGGARDAQLAVPVHSPDCFASLAGALSDDALEGRGVGTPGLAAAADLVHAALADAVGREGEVSRQPLSVVTGIALAEGNALSDDDAPLALSEDWSPMGFSASGELAGELVFAGYGIRAPDLGYDDYAGLDVAGKVVMVLRYEPREDDEHSRFDGRRPSRHSDLRYKAFQAREAGAVAMILVTPAREADEPDKLPALKVDGPTSDAGLPVIAVTRAVADRWLAGGGSSVAALAAEIDADEQPRSRVVGTTLSGRVALAPTRAEVENVVAVVPGRGALADEVVVVGAHYDHLGWGGASSMRPAEHAIHNGADDNASGTAAMICALPEALRRADGDRRTLVAIGFTAEEIGLGGSSHYVEDPVLPLERTTAMVNLDMVGRVREGKLRVMGTDSSPAWDAWVSAAAAEAGLAAELGGDGYGPSDHMAFYGAGVPVVHLFSGSHDEYHTPDDDAALLNVEGGRQVATLTAALVATALTAPERPAYVASTAGPLNVGDSRGFGAYLGTVPDYTTMMDEDGGVLLADVRGGGPAALAGLRGGDVIVDIGGVDIRNLYDMTYVLRERRPGETVAITVRRDGAEVVLQATLGRRGEEPSGGPHGAVWSPSAGTDASALLDPAETHLADLRQLTFGGENAEAYWSPDGRKLIFQATPPEGGCDQQYVLDLDTGERVMVSSGRGRTTCGYFTWPAGEGLIWSSTEHVDAACPAPPDRSRGYVWALYDYDLVRTTADGGTERFLSTPAYDAEATVCMTDGRIVFTSARDGDLELYVANADGSDLRRLTSTPGYDGGAFFTPDCAAIVWRASRPEGEELADYQALLADGLVRPGKLDIYWMNADGTGVRRLTDNGAANFGPYPLPGNTGAIYSSNAGGDPREFDLWTVDLDGGAPQRVTHAAGFDGFPMFSPDGTWLVFGSNRGGTGGETNLFLARWVP